MTNKEAFETFRRAGVLGEIEDWIRRQNPPPSEFEYTKYLWAWGEMPFWNPLKIYTVRRVGDVVMAEDEPLLRPGGAEER